jgi:hypothetical protein
MFAISLSFSAHGNLRPAVALFKMPTEISLQAHSLAISHHDTI